MGSDYEGDAALKKAMITVYRMSWASSSPSIRRAEKLPCNMKSAGEELDMIAARSGI